MKQHYRSIRDVMSSPWGSLRPAEKLLQGTDRVFRSSRLENQIYQDLREQDEAMDTMEQGAAKTLPSFPALARDVFQSFYSLPPKWNDPEQRSVAARKFHTKILEQMMQEDDYSTLKSICEGRELPAYEAASEFLSRIYERLDELMADACGKDKAAQVLQRLTDAEAQARKELAGLLEQVSHSQAPNQTLEQAVVKAANTLESKHRQMEAVSKMIDTSAAQHKEEIQAVIAQGTKDALEKAEEVQAILSAWSDEPASMGRTAVDQALLETVRGSDTLKDIAKYLGKFREIVAQGRRNGYAYGRGENYSLELGNSLSRTLSSEFAMLATPQTAPLFLRKYQRKQLKQYRRRESVHKGRGDIICCLDESSSTEGDPAAWGKAVALALLDIAAGEGRKFALIHFASSRSCQVDLFLPGAYTAEDKMKAAETFLSGGTSFERPLREAVRLMEEQGFEKADIVFLTDGKCELPEDYAQELGEIQKARRFTMTGVLFGEAGARAEFSLASFCQQVYEVGTRLDGDVVRRVVGNR